MRSTTPLTFESSKAARRLPTMLSALAGSLSAIMPSILIKAVYAEPATALFSMSISGVNSANATKR
ncbi:hypothetical protein D3C76_1752700 [compost metagenome]